MKNNIQILNKLILLLIIFSTTCFYARGQESGNVTLQVGDKAPGLQYGKWIKGTPVTQFEPGRLYILEFWATWCGPCKAMMPHLSKLAKERAGEITVIGVNIFEGSHGEKKPYDSFLPKVTRFVENMGDNMAYDVIMDNNDEYMANNWMIAAGQRGIPCSFMVKDSTILWIGHPIALDSIIQLVQTGKFSVEAERKSQSDERAEQAAGPGAYFEKIYKGYEKAINENKYDSAIRILDNGIRDITSLVAPLNFFKFQTMIEHSDEDSAMVFVRQWQSTNPGFKASVGAVIANKPGLSGDTYLYAIELLTGLIDNPQPAPFMYQEIAKAYNNKGDQKMAVESQQKAIASARQALAEGKYVGFIMEDTVKEMEDQLQTYMSKTN